MKNEFPILNYPGSKRNLLNFIDEYTTSHIPKGKAFFDIFAGSGAVSYFYKDKFKVYANDSEQYSSVILNALLKFQPKGKLSVLLEEINHFSELNKQELLSVFNKWVDKEQELISSYKYEDIEQFYLSFPNVWKGNIVINNMEITIETLRKFPLYSLFTSYYSGNYFGVLQSVEIDSIRYAIEKGNFSVETKNMLLSALFYAMKEAVFSKDGHMAQPLGINNNLDRLFKRRSVSISEKFVLKVEDFYSDSFLTEDKGNKVFNYTFDELLFNNKDIFDEVGFIYADPPYTDMQYSRYFHLLNTLVDYQYPEMTVYRGSLSRGLYTENRYQSPLSQKSKAIHYHKQLFDFCKEKQIGLAFSFAYPFDPANQQTSRYVLNIFDLIEYGNNVFNGNFQYYTQDYNHSNNRNSNSKKVLEYLLLYTP
ncbi:DNA adenine methylase [Bacillus kwashiorkori]|uniref:DNA adenine methylase n=1 Tax=Bacillus kwashiorkori TaxID=1522318 RepID=UPI000785887E|nr:DNA adenine methylase [Bacillus kwashiorkori]